MDPKIFEYYNKNSIIKYPLSENATNSSDGITIPNNLIVDALYYSNNSDVGILSVGVDENDILKIVLTDSASCSVDTSTYEPFTSVPIILENQDRGFMVFGDGIRDVRYTFGGNVTFSDCQLEKSCIILLPKIITSISISDSNNLLKGNVGLHGTDGIHLTTSGDSIEISAIYDRSDCEPENINYVKTINGISPDVNGNLILEGKNLITIDSAENGVMFQTILTPDKLCPVRFEDGTQGPQGPDGAQGPSGGMGDCQIIHPICCECEWCDSAQACVACERCDSCEKCNTCEQETPVPPYCPFDNPACFPCDSEICSYKETLPSGCDIIDELESFTLFSGTVTSATVLRDHLWLTPSSGYTEFQYWDYSVDEAYTKITTTGTLTFDVSHEYIFKFTGFSKKDGLGVVTDCVFYAKRSGPGIDVDKLKFYSPCPNSDDYFSYYCHEDKKPVTFYSTYVITSYTLPLQKKVFMLFEDGTQYEFYDNTGKSCQIFDVTDQKKSNVFPITMNVFDNQWTNTSELSHYRTRYGQNYKSYEVFSIMLNDVINTSNFIDNLDFVTTHTSITPIAGINKWVDLTGAVVDIFKEVYDTNMGSSFPYRNFNKLKTEPVTGFTTPITKRKSSKVFASETHFHPSCGIFLKIKERFSSTIYIERLHRCWATGYNSSRYIYSAYQWNELKEHFFMPASYSSKGMTYYDYKTGSTIVLTYPVSPRRFITNSKDAIDDNTLIPVKAFAWNRADDDFDKTKILFETNTDIVMAGYSKFTNPGWSNDFWNRTNSVKIPYTDGLNKNQYFIPSASTDVYTPYNNYYSSSSYETTMKILLFAQLSPISITPFPIFNFTDSSVQATQYWPGWKLEMPVYSDPMVTIKTPLTAMGWINYNLMFNKGYANAYNDSRVNFINENSATKEFEVSYNSNFSPVLFSFPAEYIPNSSSYSYLFPTPYSKSMSVCNFIVGDTIMNTFTSQYYYGFPGTIYLRLKETYAGATRTSSYDTWNPASRQFQILRNHFWCHKGFYISGGIIDPTAEITKVSEAEYTIDLVFASTKTDFSTSGNYKFRIWSGYDSLTDTYNGTMIKELNISSMTRIDEHNFRFTIQVPRLGSTDKLCLGDNPYRYLGGYWEFTEVGNAQKCLPYTSDSTPPPYTVLPWFNNSPIDITEITVTPTQIILTMARRGAPYFNSFNESANGYLLALDGFGGGLPIPGYSDVSGRTYMFRSLASSYSYTLTTETLTTSIDHSNWESAWGGLWHPSGVGEYIPRIDTYGDTYNGYYRSVRDTNTPGFTLI